MYDQADKLRNLVLRAKAESYSSGPPPYVVTVCGGKGGVGTTTLAINVAVALGQLGKRVVLVDADLQRGDVATFCGLKEEYSVADVMSARRTVHEVLQLGPAGIQILPGAWAPSRPVDWNPLAQQRLLQQLKTLGRHADIVILDAGCGGGEMLRRYWQAADRVLLITSPQSVSIMDAYATIKMFDAAAVEAELAVVVNRAESEEQAASVHQRINTSCQRFLGCSVGDAGYVPNGDLRSAAGMATTPVVIAAPYSPVARGFERVAAGVAAQAGADNRKRKGQGPGRVA